MTASSLHMMIEGKRNSAFSSCFFIRPSSVADGNMGLKYIYFVLSKSSGSETIWSSKHRASIVIAYMQHRYTARVQEQERWRNKLHSKNGTVTRNLINLRWQELSWTLIRLAAGPFNPIVSGENLWGPWPILRSTLPWSCFSSSLNLEMA